MTPILIACPKCRISLNPQVFDFEQPAKCPNCASITQMVCFPALYRQPTAGQPGDVIMAEGEASCFYHATKKAVTPCAACGRFLCALCDIELSGEHYCPTCVESGRRKGKFSTLENQRFLHGEVALTLAVVGLLVCALPAPVAIFYAMRHWKSPGSLVRRTKSDLVLAIVLSILQLVGWSIAIATGFFTD